MELLIMKKSRIIALAISLIIGVAIGFIAGVMLMSPGLSLAEAAGTIGRADQYRNVRISEADIELRNELVSNKETLEAFLAYLNFEYAANLKMSDDIAFAIESGNDVPDFLEQNNTTLDQLKNYRLFLDNARLSILQGIDVLNNLDASNKVAIHTMLNHAVNAIAQTKTRSHPVYYFMLGVEVFLENNPGTAFPHLARAHDLLLSNMMMISVVHLDRPVLEHLLGKQMLEEDTELVHFDMEVLKSKLMNDLLRIDFPVIVDRESLGSFRSSVERLSDYYLNVEQLRNAAGMSDRQQESLSVFLDAGKLQAGFPDSEKLSRLVDSQNLGVFNSDKLKHILFGAEKLNGIVFY